VVGGEEQDSGFRIQESGFRGQDSGVRSQNEEHLLSAFCLLLTADCLLQLVGVLVGGSLGPHRSLRQHVTAEKGRKN
jgi:hypothetical protein